MCEGDEEVTEDPQPDPDPQPTPTYNEDTGEFATEFNGKEEKPSEFPVIPVTAIGVGTIFLIAALA